MRIGKRTGLLGMLVLIGASAAMAEDEPGRVPDLVADIVVEGSQTVLEPGRWRLGKGATLALSSADKFGSQRLEVRGEAAEVTCDGLGIQRAEGRFTLEFDLPGGAILHLPRRIRGLGRGFQLLKDEAPEDETFLFVRGEPDRTGPTNRVAYHNGVFTLEGFASAEAVYPASAGLPRTLVSVAGQTSETVVETDLAQSIRFRESRFPFWRAARADLDQVEKTLRNLAIDPERVGAQAYLESRREGLDGVAKIREGYQMLQRNLYSQQVIGKLLENGIEIPRLILAEAIIVRGQQAFSIQPFLNWRQQGRVLVDRARLITPTTPETRFSPVQFQVEGLSNAMGEDTRLLIDGPRSRVEVRRSDRAEWRARRDHQFDLDSRHLFSPSDATFEFKQILNADGFFRRKGMTSRGDIELGDLVLSRDLLRFRFHPRSRYSKPAGDIRGFMDIRRLLLFPDRERRGKLLPPAFRNEKAVTFLGEALDQIADAVHDRRIKKIVGLEVEIDSHDAPRWSVRMRADGGGGRQAVRSIEGDLPEAPTLREIWIDLDTLRDRTDWLDFGDEFLWGPGR